MDDKSRIAELEKALKDAQKHNKNLEERLNRQKTMVKEVRAELKKKRADVENVLRERNGSYLDRIPRHRYNEVTIRYVVLMMVYAGVSARQTGKALEVFNLVFGKLTDDIPSYQTALDWVKKCGLSVYENARRRPSLREVDYSIIMDNSITIGGQDGKDGEYSELVQKIGYARKYGHTPIAHLMPPRRRAYARFMNVFDSIQWAHDIMQSDFKLPALARHLFGFVNTHASLFEEMQEVMDAYRYMEHLCKEKGLSRTTAAVFVYNCISMPSKLNGRKVTRKYMRIAEKIKI